MPEPAKAVERKKEARIASHASEVTRSSFSVELVPMMFIDALEIYDMFTVYPTKSWMVLAVLVVLLLIVNWVYFSKRTILAKYLAPGMIFLLIYQAFIMGYTGYIPFTDYGQGYNPSKADAVASILQTSEQRAEGTPSLPAAVVEDSDNPGFAVVDTATGAIRMGDSETPLYEVSGTYAAGAISAVDSYKVLTIAKTLQPETQQKAPTTKVPASDNLNDGSYRSDDGSIAYLAKSRYNYDEAADTLTDTTTDVVYTANSKIDALTNMDSNQIGPGWRVFVDFDDCMNMFARGGLAGPFLKALPWSLAFVTASVLLIFAFGLTPGFVLADKRIKGRKIYQSLIILFHAFPAFLATLVWKGMLNKGFGFINEVLLGGTNIPWLTNGTPAKFSILGVNLWLGFPYMLLVCLGALQSLPGDAEEAVKIGGASGLRTVWFIKSSLVLQSTVPLLIAPSAFNFNNFSLIYMLTDGGPNYPGLDVDQTDILIPMAYKIAIESGSPNYDLVSAISIVILIAVGVIAQPGLRQTETLEEL